MKLFKATWSTLPCNKIGTQVEKEEENFNKFKWNGLKMGIGFCAKALDKTYPKLYLNRSICDKIRAKFQT
jgi:hypothetical protein